MAIGDLGSEFWISDFGLKLQSVRFRVCSTIRTSARPNTFTPHKVIRVGYNAVAGELTPPEPQGDLHHFCNASTRTIRCPANMEHVRQSRPDSGLDLEVEDLKTIPFVPFSLNRGLLTQVKV